MFKIFEKSANYTKNTERFHKIQNKIFRRRQLCNSATDRLSCCLCKRRLCIEHCRGLQRIYVRWAEENNKTEWIQAFFGSLEEKQKPVGSKYDLHRPSDEESYLDHGYDESAPPVRTDTGRFEESRSIQRRGAPRRGTRIYLYACETEMRLRPIRSAYP